MRSALSHLVPVLLLTSLWLSLALASPGSAKDEASGQAPDVLVMVHTQLPGAHWVSLTYFRQMPRTETENQLALVLKETGWTASNIAIMDGSSPDAGESPMTSVEFSTPAAADLSSGTFPIEPLITALKGFRRIEIRYFVPPNCPFAGLGDYENKYVNIRLERGTNSYAYLVDVKDAGFRVLGLPLVAPSQTATDTGRRMPSIPVLVLAIVLALLAAVLTFYAANRISRASGRIPNQRS